MDSYSDPTDHPGAPVPQPSPQRSGPEGGPPTPPTAVATEGRTGELLIVNLTDLTWQIARASGPIATVAQEDEHVAYTPRAGVVFATSEVAADHDPLIVHLDPTIWGVEIARQRAYPETFIMQALMRRPRAADALPASAPIEGLNLLDHTEIALKHAGIYTLGDALRTDVDDILALPHYPLRTLFDLLEQVHQLRVL